MCALCAEGIIAGSTRNCMPRFDVGILASQFLLLNMFGVPAMVIAGIPALLVAAYPGAPTGRGRGLSFVFAALLIAVVATAAIFNVSWAAALVWPGIIVAGALVGFWIRVIDRLRQRWFAIGVAAALGIGGIIFSLGHYGPNNCWP